MPLEAEISQVDLGEYHGCALTDEGNVYCWGNNNWGQVADSTELMFPIPIQVALPGVAVAVDVGDFHSCAILVDGTAMCWGINSQGQLGNGDFIDSSTPVKVLIPGEG